MSPPTPVPAGSPAFSCDPPGQALPGAGPATAISVRKLEIDLSEGFARHWHGGDAFLSQYYNALSMAFPVGEQFFIDSVRASIALLPKTPENALLHDAAARFIGQEATHRHLHGLYNAQLQKQGLVNRWQDWVTARVAREHRRGAQPLELLATTIAYEHLTAVLSDDVLRHDRGLNLAEPRLQLLWRWHASEETEHGAVCYDLYQALGGSHAQRIRAYAQALKDFTLESVGQTALNLWHDGTLFKPSTWWSAARLFLGKNGMVWCYSGALLAYFRRDFHPDQDSHPAPEQHSQALARRWLSENAGSFRVVR